MENKSPTLRLDRRKQKLMAQLETKLKEYQTRNPYRAPEENQGDCCKARLLEHLLRDGEVKTWDVCRELNAAYSGSLDPWTFDNACKVVRAYCTGRMDRLVGGTGLPGADTASQDAPGRE